MMRPYYPVLICALLALLACDTSPPDSPDMQTHHVDPLAEILPTGETTIRTCYVPAYSYLPRHPNAEGKKNLWILLSVRNVDSEATLTLTHVDYFNTEGERVRRYLTTPRTLRPLETAEFKVEERDNVGGSGANFLVYWEGPADAHALLTEAVMYGFDEGVHFSFTSRGIELDRRPPQGMFDVKRDELRPTQDAQQDVDSDMDAGRDLGAL
jgi:hypothetical protein